VEALAMSFDVDVVVVRGKRCIAAKFAASTGLTALFGPSGIGKTSVLDAIAGLLRPASGRIVVAGDTLFDAGERVDVPPERRGCGYVFQDDRLFPHLNVGDNLLFGHRLAPEHRRIMAPGDAIDLLGIGHLLARMPRTLSGGEAQRVAIGRALLSGPRVLLLDEPLTSLDMERRDEIMRLIERIRDEVRLPILYVSHDRAEVERLADQVVVLG
jgi:molybdate transport system ATP-binding protein